MTFTIRRAAAADLPALTMLEQSFPGDRLSRSNFRHLLTRARADIWVCVAAGTPVGNAIVLFKKNSRRARLYSLVVAPSERGRGIARALAQTAEIAAADRGCNCMHLEVREDNAVATRLYAKLGYRFAHRVEGFYDDGHDALRLERTLARNGERTDRAA